MAADVPGIPKLPRIGESTQALATANMSGRLATFDSDALVSWDCIPTCSPEDCPIGSVCVYLAESQALCALQTAYLQNLVDCIYSTYRHIDGADSFKIGMHLIPLYSQLCQQKIVAKSVGVGGLTYLDHRGGIKIHPIYKEIRDTLKCITMTWREMGFFRPPNPELPGGPGSCLPGNNGFGDPNHYTNITKDAEEKRNLVR